MSDDAVAPGGVELHIEPPAAMQAKAAAARAETAAAIAAASAGDGDSPTTKHQWAATIQRCSPAIVVLRVCLVRAFEESPGTFQHATGFVVDAKRGIILTNRHVVTTGPVMAEAMFQNREEVPVIPIYRDPVHDFGLFAYDPAAVKFMEVTEIPLRPDEAVVGTDIRVCGNDAGEKFQILSGTLARLDRKAPAYGRHTYNDFNTFYLAAASSTTGGSSGSPVLNVAGHAIALNAGGKTSAASAFYLPLNRVVRALRLVQAGFRVPRGTVQSVFLHRAFDEVRRLGLPADVEELVRAEQSDETGMLCVSEVVKDGAAHNILHPGDVILRVNGKLCTSFYALEELLDNTTAIDQAFNPDAPGEGILPADDAARNGSVDTATRQSAIAAAAAESARVVADSKATRADDAEPAGATTADAGGSDSAAAGAGAGAGAGAATAPSSVATRPSLKRQKSFQLTAPRLAAPSVRGVPREHRRVHTAADLGTVVTTTEQHSLPLSDPRLADPSAPAPAGGPTVVFEVQRGTQTITVTVPVVDLHALMPYKVLCISGASLHALSYQQCRNNGIPARGVYLSSRGYMFSWAEVPTCAVLTEINKHPVESLEEAEAVLARVPDLQYIQVRYFVLGDVHRSRVSIVQVDRHWFSMCVRTRDDHTGFWLARTCADPPPQPAPTVSEATFPKSSSQFATDIAQSLVTVEFHTPVMVDGVHASTFVGIGVVVDAEKGLVVVDRNTAAISLGDIIVTVASSIELAARLVYQHVVHNFAVIQYDPALLGSTPVKTARLSSKRLVVGDRCQFVGLTNGATRIHQECVVTKCEELFIRDASPPRFRAYNEDTLMFDRVAVCNGGVFCDNDGAVQAFWASYSQTGCRGEAKDSFEGMPIELVQDVVEPLRRGVRPVVKSLEVEFIPSPLSMARSGMGFPARWVTKFEIDENPRRQVLGVRRCIPRSDANTKLKEGDLLLAINGKTMISYRDVELAVQNSEADSVTVTILRKEEEVQVDVKLATLDSMGTIRVVSWAGLLLHATPRPVQALGFMPETVTTGVYCSRWSYGAPAHKYGLRATLWVTEVNNKPTPDLDAFNEATRGIQHMDNVRLKTVDLQGRHAVRTLKTDLVYFFGYELTWDAATGQWHQHEPTVNGRGVVTGEKVPALPSADA